MEKLCCFLTGPWPICEKVGDTGERAMGREEGPDGLGNAQVKVLGGAGGGALGDIGCRTGRDVGGENSAAGEVECSEAAGLKSYTMLGNF